MAQGFLLVIGGNDRGKRFDLTLPETRIGRGADQDVVLSDIAVSRRHVTIHMEGARYRLRDLGSGNGSLVNGQRVDQHVLNDGDHIEIGQTVMRFESAAARPIAAGPPMNNGGGGYAPPQSPRPMPPAPSAQVVTGSTPFGPPGPAMETPSDAILAPPAGFARAEPFQTGQRSDPSIGLLGVLENPMKRLIVFGGMGFICLIGLIIIFARTVFAKPPVVASEAEEMYRQGLRLYTERNYEGAKISFNEAMVLVPDSPEVKRYLTLCESEIQAQGSLRSAERDFAGRRYVVAIKALDRIDSGSILYEQAQKLRKENAPRAAAELFEEAKRLAPDDADTAREKLNQALVLDPGNEEARALAPKLKSSLPPVPIKEEPKEKDPPPEPVAVAPKPVKEPKEPKEPKPIRDPKPAKPDKGDDLAIVKVKPKEATPPPVKEPAGTPVVGTLGGSALALYKNKDFAGAERAYRQQAMNESAKQAEKTIALAGQVKNVKLLLDRAASQEASKPDAALKDYEEALALDGKIAKGVHKDFFRGKIAKLQGGAANTAFTQGKYDVAFALANAAKDQAMLKQLDGKAAELVTKGQGMQKSNLVQAKQYWRMVIRMVPVGSPNYTKAYQLLNNAGAAHKDEDED
jgi:tetratricopeptide (TPR) repeat protein